MSNNNDQKWLLQEVLGYKPAELAKNFLKDDYLYKKASERALLDGRLGRKPPKSNTGVKFQINHAPETIIDYLSFSFPLSSLSSKHLDKNALGIKFPSQDFTRDIFKDKELKFSPVTGELLEDLPEVFTTERSGQTLFSDVTRLSKLMMVTFGLRMGEAKGYGKNHYKQCHDLFAGDGSYVGFVCYGGNNDTGFVNITGTGMSFVRELRTPPEIYYFLNELFCVSSISRIDIAFDDFHGMFTAKHCEDAYYDKGFSTGGKYPVIGYNNTRNIDGQMLGNTVYVGSRQSTVFWRTYDKSAEQGLEPDFQWWRNEAELKKVPLEILLDTDGFFSGLNAYAASMVACANTQSFDRSKKRSERTVDGVLSWVRKVAAPTFLELARCFSGVSCITEMDDESILRSFRLITNGIEPKSQGLPPQCYEAVPF
jgi:phage replication initiation protein